MNELQQIQTKYRIPKNITLMAIRMIVTVINIGKERIKIHNGKSESNSRHQDFELAVTSLSPFFLVP